MKEHLNLDSVSVSKNWMESHQKSGVVSPKQEILDDTLLTAEDDLFESQVKGNVEFDDSLIDNMNFDDVMEHLSFIRQQSQTTEGRSMMSMAHNPISSQQVVQLFGA